MPGKIGIGTGCCHFRSISTPGVLYVRARRRTRQSCLDSMTVLQVHRGLDFPRNSTRCEHNMPKLKKSAPKTSKVDWKAPKLKGLCFAFTGRFKKDNKNWMV